MVARGTLFLSGATGHTGCRLARRLLDDGWRLRCLVRTPGHRRFLPEHASIQIIAGDLTEPGSWSGQLACVDAFIHAAHVGYADHVVRACHSAGVRRVISLSSTRRFTRFPEKTAALVIAGEAALEASGLDHTILRPAMIYGGDRDNNIERLVRWLRRHHWLPLIAGGHNLVQPIFVADLVDAIVRSLERPASSIGRTLTLAGPEPMTQRALVETTARALGVPLRWIPVPYAAAMAGAAVLECLPRPPVTRAQVRRTLEDKAFDISEARVALGGWQPRPFRQGIELKLAGQA